MARMARPSEGCEFSRKSFLEKGVRMNPGSSINTEEKQFIIYSNGTPPWYPVQFHFFNGISRKQVPFLFGNVCVCVALHCAGSRVNLSLLGLTALEVNQEILFCHNQCCASKCLTARSLNKFARVHV